MQASNSIVTAGTHEELMKIQIKKDVNGDPVQGYYHNQWDTQMGEEVRRKKKEETKRAGWQWTGGEINNEERRGRGEQSRAEEGRERRQ